MSDSVTHKKKQNDSDRNEVKASPTALEARFAHAQSQLNPRRQQLIRAILESAEETYFLSSRELAKRYRVDAATIVRAIQVLGYESFADFAADLRQHFVTRITTVEAALQARKQGRRHSGSPIAIQHRSRATVTLI